MRRGLWGALKLETPSSEVARHDRGDWMEHRGVPATPCGDRAEARAPSSTPGCTPVRRAPRDGATCAPTALLGLPGLGCLHALTWASKKPPAPMTEVRQAASRGSRAEGAGAGGVSCPRPPSGGAFPPSTGSRLLSGHPQPLPVPLPQAPLNADNGCVVWARQLMSLRTSKMFTRSKLTTTHHSRAGCEGGTVSLTEVTKAAGGP